MYVPTWAICGWCFTLWHSITHWETPGPSSQTQRPVESSRLSMLVTSPNPGGSRFTFRKTGGTLCWKWMDMMDGNGLSVPISLGGVHLKTIQAESFSDDGLHAVNSGSMMLRQCQGIESMSRPTQMWVWTIAISNITCVHVCLKVGSIIISPNCQEREGLHQNSLKLLTLEPLCNHRKWKSPEMRSESPWRFGILG
jgi:hypothetical protein